MKIIDAHLHLFPPDPRSDAMAQGVGHENTQEHLKDIYSKLNIVHGIVMGNRSLALEHHRYACAQFHYCVGIDSVLGAQGQLQNKNLPYIIEQHLRQDACCGVKLYSGYNKIWLSDACYHPIYQLAARYHKPVAVHTGLTSHPRAHLKYAHPLVLDEVASDFPDTQFVMCHFGNPFLESAVAVLEKNNNVSADLSGLLEGRFDLKEYLHTQAGYVNLLRAWLIALDRWDKLMFGTDWPIVNIGEYIDFIKALVPEEHWEQVFFENANKIYGLGL